ncbi:inositol monophosphatase family protein [Nocardioides sp.]|uniref:inositol monophosphatase family protein n=1 Tax=Nocardioides sp. TaxID=35761 RepID=UPI003D0FD353
MSTAAARPGDLRDLALDVARQAAELARGRRAAGVEVAATKTSATDVVTEADRATELLIRELIARQRPDDAFLGEEGDDVAGSSGVRWIVDPIDGTVNFLYGMPHYAVSIAAEVEGEVVAGVVLNAHTGTEYVAVRGEGATRDGTPLRVRDKAPLTHRLLGTGFSYIIEARVLQAEALVRLLPRIRDVRRYGSSALDVCMVAEGRADGYYEEGVHHWDYAASVLIATEAGAAHRLTEGRWGGKALVCAPADGFDELVTLLDEVGMFGE